MDVVGYEPLARRSYIASDIVELSKRYRTWGMWGDSDELGAANRLTGEHVKRSASLVKDGSVFPLSLPFDRDGPQTGHKGRVNPQLVVLQSGGDLLLREGGTEGFGATDDAVYMPLQSSTQWDALCHVFYDGQTYNGKGPASVTSSGAQFASITNLIPKSVGRGVLLDVPRALGREWLEASEAIQAADLDHTARVQGVDVTEGDFVLIRTGMLTQCRNRGGWGDYAGGPAPGLGVDAANFLCPRGVAAIATDTWGAEALPYECQPPMRAPLHVVLLVNAGIYIGEMWDLDVLATDCAGDGRYEFMLTAAPLRITGAVGSPVTPLAIK
jgi:kynurenine formamidase